MTAHNHPPRCCCEADDNPTGSNERLDCALCPEHGELAQLADPECPSCHTHGEHPHTEYCQLVDHASQLTHAELEPNLAAHVKAARRCADHAPHEPHIRFDDSPHTNCPGRP